MNQAALKLAAEKLKAVAEALISNGDREVQSFLEALRPLVEDAIGLRIGKPMEWRDVPGGWQMSETHLRNRPELESAYAEFKIELTGGESPVLKRLRAKGKQQ